MTVLVKQAACLAARAARLTLSLSDACLPVRTAAAHRRAFSSALPAAYEEEDEQTVRVSTLKEPLAKTRPRLQELRQKLQTEGKVSPKDEKFMTAAAAPAPHLRLAKNEPLASTSTTDGFTRDDWLALVDALPDIPTSDAANAATTALTDRFHRTHNYLRLSLAERCNLRCTYCMPADGVPLQPQQNLLQTDELLHLARFFRNAGVDKFRLTGGEPTLRADLREIVQGLSDTQPRQIGMTTNGVALASKLPDLVQAGLNSVNVSLDTLQADKWETLTRRPVSYLHKVLQALEVCYEHMPHPSQIKINCVLQRGVNTDEVADFISLGLDRFPGIAVRFIEYMPFTDNGWELDKLVPYREVLANLDELRNRNQSLDWQWSKVPQTDPHDTTQWYKAWYDASGQEDERHVNLGFITSMSRPFCAGCNRLRLSADGQLKVCLFGSTIHPHPPHLPSLWSLRDALRVGQLDDSQLAKLVYAALQTKERALGGHDSPQMIHEHARENKPMTLIGG